MTQTYVRPDAVNVTTLKLYSADKSKFWDISPQVLEFSIYEDVMFPVVRAEFTMYDAIDILNNYPIIAEEFIEVEFSNPGVDLNINYTFKIKSIESLIISPQAKLKTYIIRAVSEEMFTNNKKTIAKKYSTDSSNIITDIMINDIGTQKDVVTGDDTKGIQDLIISRLRPFQAIDMIRRRSVSKDYLSSSYVFFENKRGFNFCSLEFLFDVQNDNIEDKIFFYDTTGNSDARNLTTRNMLGLINISQVNNVKKLIHGSLNNTVKRFDLLTGQTQDTQYINSQKQQNFKFASENPKPLNSSSFEQQYGSDVALSMLVPHSTHLPENYIAESLGAKHSFVTKISQNIFHSLVNGDVALTAGDVITVKIPAVSGSGTTQENRLLAGNYMMSKVRHIVINSSSAQKTYHCALELIKGNYEDNA